LEKVRLGHRIVTDQSFPDQSEAIFRLRYRLTLELPLRGIRLDPKEPYLKISQEQLHIFENGAGYELELRLLLSFGFLFNDRNKVEFGLDYRLDEFLIANSRQRLFATINWYYSL
jgi:hypothetical protein